MTMSMYDKCLIVVHGSCKMTLKKRNLKSLELQTLINEINQCLV